MTVRTTQMPGGARAAAKPRLLFLSHTLPFPLDSGAHVRSYHLLRLLAEEFDITALCFYRPPRRTAADVDAAVAALSACAGVTAFPVPQDGSRLRLLVDHLRSVAQRRPYTKFTYGSAACRRTLRELLAGQRFALAHIDSLDLAAYLPLLSDVPLVCCHHNIESDLLRRRAEFVPSRLLRAYFRFQARLLAESERFWSRAALNVVVSERDREILLRHAPDAEVLIVPNGVDTSAFRPAPPGAAPAAPAIVFIGPYSWAPNRDAMEFFCVRILPLVRARQPHAEVTWIGHVPDEARRTLTERYDVRFTGYVTRLDEWLARATCVIVPLRAGGGTRIKILDAWAAGCAVVSTRAGCEGLAADDGHNILIRDDPAAFADAVCQILEDHRLLRALGAAARATAEEHYDWQRIREMMIPEYLRLAAGSTRAAGVRHDDRQPMVSA
jgi:polysaccharide biosynthesis protein PslH